MLLLLSDGQLCCAGAEHVSALLPDEAPPLADGALEQAASELPPLKEWTSRADGALCAAASAARAAVGSALPPVGAAAAPAAVAKQAARVAWVNEQMAAHELHGEERLEEALEASRSEALLEEEEARLRRKLGKRRGGEEEAEAVDETWEQFQAVCDVLRMYGALDAYNATELGELVGALSG